MMVMDACFILEFFNCSQESDSFSGNRLLPENVIFDLILLENQIPFFFLDEIYQCTILKNHPHISLIQFIYPVLNDLSIFRAYITINDISLNAVPHILSLLHECYKPPSYTTSVSFPSTIHSVVDLDRAGVNFKPNKYPTWVKGMEVKLPNFPRFFGSWSKPTLRIPVMYIHDFTELVLKNLIAYERQSSQTSNYITSYATAIDKLIDTQEDVAKLIDSKVLVNGMGSNEEAATMINSICKEVACPEFFYGVQWEKLNKYCNRYWPKNIAWLRRTYFSSPWNIIALFVGVVLFTLTVVQTIFAIKST
ncbi:hypothetical protein L1987_82618 [Smallanthus sonchifolius]|uniref:Uncharacterized protein n=1 Tax=Smallanthus sonchifolius TaxID=185202 RepID=A0ACB8YBG7_9ASTR|nr:hypothetical protein L1987_82618 [Smallanthus sonchifolius]